MTVRKVYVKLNINGRKMVRRWVLRVTQGKKTAKLFNPAQREA